MNLTPSFDVNLDIAYIIRIKDNQTSEQLAERCANSCRDHNINFEFFDAIDATSGEIILTEEQKTNQYLNLIKLTNTLLSPCEIACFISHYLLWCKCIELNEPIIILEHDAVMIKNIAYHPFFNMIQYLGAIEQLYDLKPVFPIPPHGQLHGVSNFRFMLRTHAYSIDPMIAKNLIARAISTGISTSADAFMRIDTFAIIQSDVYAVNVDGDTTINDRTGIDLETSTTLGIS